MRIAQVTTVHPGTENRIAFKHCLALRDAGHDVHLVAPSPTPSIDGVQHHLVSTSGSRALRALRGSRQVITQLRAIKPDVVHIHDPELIPAAILFAKLHRVRLIYDAHENLVAQIVSKPYLHPTIRPLVRQAAAALEGLADRMADAVVVAEAELSPTYPHNRRVVPVRNYPWLTSTPVTPPREGRAVIGYVGAVTLDRGLDTMLEIARRSRHRPLLRVAGKCHPATLAEEMSPDVEYLGPITPSEVPDFLASLDVGLCLLKRRPNYINARATKIYEYMLAGRPFLYSDFPAWVDEHGSAYGIPIDPADVEAATYALDALLDETPDQRQRRGELGRFRVETDFVYNREAEALIGLYDELFETIEATHTRPGL